MSRPFSASLAVFLVITGVVVNSGADRGLLQSQRPPCLTRVSGWFQCGTADGQSPGALCLPLCVGERASGPCQPCTDPNSACNTAWRSYNGLLQASLSFNSTEICPQLADRMSVGSSGGQASEGDTCSCPCSQQQPQT
ncbi:hypothetical protein COCSUDRAFT_52270 [Coccomyxa subellipsoidea C-169]|uniref:Uncharacterized protein n=1 Tax=Coccomyxa subellipsoidea (strain C-169) TaxID=574566 RepID=I0ZAW5_COCSC|nr:hypothetical protein COCSUDRAFT_52270 [Coccomyxa subellipsoidea C-169]EIE27784.1 hypothetical protein COCSUDRAFT_52270 [Coccomyxa subellipsoidea C-169]|eukprot:XP_005652328.1 hypothetical protein COCSUDRAFT_52270 [Coccomyxa subellipsoidea C-169]